jgi:hypothetical protein
MDAMGAVAGPLAGEMVPFDDAGEPLALRDAGHVGQASLGIWAAAVDLVSFIGVCAQSLGRMARGKAWT